MDVSYGESMVSAAKLQRLRELLLSTAGIDGIVVEVGVYRGGSARVLADNAGSSRVLLFDTFSGIPSHEAGVDGDWGVGTLADASLDAVRGLFSGNDNVSCFAGVFPGETGTAIKDGEAIRFAHLDVDNFRSYIESLAFIYPRMAPGGVIVFDDYGERCCPGATAAVDAFFTGKEHVQTDTAAFVVKA